MSVKMKKKVILYKNTYDGEFPEGFASCDENKFEQYVAQLFIEDTVHKIESIEVYRIDEIYKRCNEIIKRKVNENGSKEESN